MTENSAPKFVVNERIEIGVSLMGILAVMAAAYYTGRTGAWEPLMAIAMGLALVLLFVTSEE